MTTSTAGRTARLALCSAFVVGGVAAGLVATSGVEPGAAAAPVVGEELTPEEAALVGQLDPRDRARFLLQKRIQEQAEIASLLSQVHQLRHDTAISVVNGIR